MRAHDWASTAVGAIEQWPSSLKTAVSLLLNSRYPMSLWWGAGFVNFYNDAYAPMLGRRHPSALGRPARDTWVDIWPIVGPQAEAVLRTGEASWNEDVCLVTERNEFREETYLTYCYSPLMDSDGTPAGVFCVCTDETARVLSARRMKTLHGLGDRTRWDLDSRANAARASIEVLADNPHDIAFASIYLRNSATHVAELCDACRVPIGSMAAPAVVSLGSADDLWDFASVAQSATTLIIDDVEGRFGRLSAGAWEDDAARSAAVIPLAAVGRNAGLLGFMVVGLSPRLAFDAPYRDFLELAAAQVAAAVANADAYESERRRAESLEELDRAKTAFVANVSHEFRTPLTLMLGPLADLLLEPEPLSDHQREVIDTASRNANRLLKLVNGLLEFSRLEAGRATPHFEATDLPALTAEVASMFRSTIERAGLSLVVDCEPMETVAAVDRQMWETIVGNLLSNAFKFTFAGRITVKLRQQGAAAVLTVRDTGTGIALEELPRVFERFHRIANVRARTFEGTGIGLALVREIVKLHRGTIEVSSEEGRGTTFQVTVPVTGVADAHAADLDDRAGANVFVDEAKRWVPSDGVSTPSGRDTATARLLFVDDNADLRRYAASLLGADYTVVTVSTAADALRVLARSDVDLIITDAMMPGLNGLGFVERVRCDPTTALIPILMLSARAGAAARVEGLAAGVDDYIEKPFSGAELRARVGTHLALARARQQSNEHDKRIEAESVQARLVATVAQLEKSHEALRAVDQHKSEFLAMLGHELRTPLAPIRNATEILRLAGPENERQRWARSILERQVRFLASLVDDLLDVTRIARGQIELHRSPIDLRDVIQAAVEASRTIIDGYRHRLDVAIGYSIMVDGDRTRLVQVVCNLLNNAAKFTDPGGSIQVSALTRGGEAIITISDDGVGMTREMLDKVFELFMQGDRSRQRTQAGLGIGLTLARRLVELHGGTITAFSDGPNRGSQFVVTLPAAARPR
ncbi:MAG TPA: ATP-binding protein [Vicinamibacterales bacterium]|nr:ATP-binding protein [Vicinamibacterales bacterium]